MTNPMTPNSIREEAAKIVREEWNAFANSLSVSTETMVAAILNRLYANSNATAASPAVEPTGWKLVPIEPTEAMQDAFYRDNGEPRLLSRWFAVAYQEMLAAAPIPPEVAK